MKNKAPVIIAVVVGIIAVLAIRSYMKEIQQAPEVPQATVVVAKRDIQQGTEITRDLVKPASMPKEFVTTQHIKGPNAVMEIEGRKALVQIKAGQFLLWSHLMSPETLGGFQSAIPAGERAFTIKLSTGVKPELIGPSDHVDILASFALPEKKKSAEQGDTSWRARSDMVNIVLLQHVTVLAVGTSYMRGGEGGKTGNDLTVAVTLPEAQLLMFAAQHGELAAVLRKHDDIQIIDRNALPRITFQELEKLVGDLDAQREDRIVQILKAGGKIEEVSVDNK